MGPDDEWDRKMDEWDRKMEELLGECVDSYVDDEVLPSLDGTLSYRTGEVIELLCNRRLTFLDLDRYGINIISEERYR